MPVPLTYPGVYIEELPSGVRTIELAKSLVGSLRERKKIAAEEKKAYETTFAAIAEDIGSLLG